MLSQPADFVGFSTSPRQGPVGRSGFEPSLDAAGSVGPRFEPRAIIVGQQSRKCADVGGVDWTGSAGHLSPRVDLRSLHIDDSVRRARSEPPVSLSTRLEVALAQKAFGVCADTGRRRLIEQPMSVHSRAEVASQSAKLGIMENLLEKRHFHGSPPGSSLSPRMANQGLAAIDIDSHAGRLHKVTPSQPGFLPLGGETWDLQVADTSKASFRRFVEQNLLADQYAALLDRPSARRSHPNQRLLELENGWNTYGSCRRSNSARPALVSRQLSRVNSHTSVGVQETSPVSLKEKIGAKQHSQRLFSKQTSHLSDASTACSLDDIAERSPLQSLMPSPMESPCESDVDDCSSTCASEDEFPLSVQRVLSAVQGTSRSSSLALAAAAAFRDSEVREAVVPIHRRCVGLSGRAKQVANSSMSARRAAWQ